MFFDGCPFCVGGLSGLGGAVDDVAGIGDAEVGGNLAIRHLEDAGVTFGLEFAEFSKRAAEDVVGLGSGAIYRFLNCVLGVGPSILWAGEVEFEDATAAETPGGSHDLGGEGLFEDASGREFGHEFREGLSVFLVFALEDEVAPGEETVFGAVAGGDGLAGFGARAGVSQVCCHFSFLPIRK